MTTSGPGGATLRSQSGWKGTREETEDTGGKENNRDVTYRTGKQTRVLRVQDGACLNINNHDFSTAR